MILSYLLLLLFAFPPLAAPYAIEGNWELTHLQQQPMPHSVQTTIKDFIFRNSTIKWSLTFSGCNLLKYQMEVAEDQLFINFDSFYREERHECDSEKSNAERNLASLMRRSFRFQIFSDFMVFSDLVGNVLVKLVRESPTRRVDLEGSWKVLNVFSNKTSHLLQIDDNKFTFCQKKASLEFQLKTRNRIQLSNVQNKGCGSKSLMQAFNEVKYYKKIQETLTLYSQSLQPIITMELFNMEEELRKRQEEVRKKEEEKRREAQAKRKQILRARQAERRRKEEEEKNKVPSDLLGKWKIYKIFGIPIQRNHTELIIGEDQMILAGCNSHITSYTFGDNIFSVGKIKSTKKICKIDQDGLYKRGLEKIHNYSTELEGDQVVVSIFGDNNKLIFQLRENAPKITIKLEDRKDQYLNGQEKKEQAKIQEGRYMILLLKRRDLQRKMVRISKQGFTLKICHQMVYSYKTSNNRIELSLEKKENRVPFCNLERENVYLEEIEKVTSFESDERDYVLKSGGESIINLDFIGS